MFPWEVARVIEQRPICFVPLGVLEWHGEHAATGLDGLKAHAICVEAARQSGGVVVPTLWWGTDWREDLGDGSYLTGGIERGERYHVPGSMFWIRPETHLNLMLDIYEAMRRRGFKAIVVLAGHWSRSAYIPTLRESGRAFLEHHPQMHWALFTDQELAGNLLYPHEHAAGGESSLLLAIRPELVDLDLTFETDQSRRSWYAGSPEHLERRRTTPNRYIGVLTGVEDDSNDPKSSASAQRGEVLLSGISTRLAKEAARMLESVD
jgi:creatinine amidohydrolase